MASSTRKAFKFQIKMTKSSSSLIRKKENANRYLTYNKIIQSKKCVIQKTNITKISAEITMQSILDHTIQRTVQADLLKPEINIQSQIEIILKRGYDDTSGPSNCQPKFHVEGEQKS